MEDIKEALNKIKDEKILNESEKKALTKFADMFISCSLKDPRTEDIVKHVNMHHHTKTCRKYGCTCRFYYPRFPTLRTIISVPVKILEPSKEAQDERSAQSKEVLDKVKKVLEDKETMEEICKINQEEIEQYKKTLKAIQKIELVNTQK